MGRRIDREGGFHQSAAGGARGVLEADGGGRKGDWEGEYLHVYHDKEGEGVEEAWGFLLEGVEHPTRLDRS